MKNTSTGSVGQASSRKDFFDSNLYRAAAHLPVKPMVRVIAALLLTCIETNPSEDDFLTSYVSQRHIAEQAECGVENVRRAIRELESLGVFLTKHRGRNTTNITTVVPDRLIALGKEARAYRKGSLQRDESPKSGTHRTDPTVKWDQDPTQMPGPDPTVKWGNLEFSDRELSYLELLSAPPAPQEEPSSPHEAAPPEPPASYVATKPEATRWEPPAPLDALPTQEPQEALGDGGDEFTPWYQWRGDLIAETAAERLQALVAKGTVQPAIATALYREIDVRRLELGQATAHLDVNNLDEREVVACAREWTNKIAPKHRTTRCDAAVSLIVEFLEGKTGYVDKHRRAHYSSRVNRRVA